MPKIRQIFLLYTMLLVNLNGTAQVYNGKNNKILHADTLRKRPKPDTSKIKTQYVVIKLKDSEKNDSIFNIINAVLQTLSFVAVVITLVYLSIQTKLAAKNTILASFQHTQNHLNQFNVAINQSSELADIIIKGRKSFTKLTQKEKIRFEHTYGWLVNILEGWYILVIEANMSGEFKEDQIANIKSIVQYYFSYPGVKEFWSNYQSMYIPEICELINQNIVIGMQQKESEIK